MVDGEKRRSVIRKAHMVRISQHLGPEYALRLMRRMDRRINIAHHNMQLSGEETQGKPFQPTSVGASNGADSLKAGMKNRLSKKGGNK